ncbi:MAG TPA: hypothetical protein VF062_05195 [Candidatus Limnocylindrales bacterium]
MRFLVPTEVLYPEVEGEPPIADLDWATRMLRFFIPHTEFERVASVSSPAELTWRDRYTLEAIVHEHAHVLQLSLTGFGYDFSVRLFEIVVAAARAHRTLDGVYAHRGDFVEALEPLFSTLDRVGPHGLTPRSIMESSAFLIQKRPPSGSSPPGRMA